MLLKEIEADLFDLFYQWLYSQKLWDANADQAEWLSMRDLLRLYMFAEISNIDKTVPFIYFPYTWENTSPSDQIRTLVVGWLV
ncbi:hypothetical protein BDZ45DRAFT_739493 [Acephala macrosclerotiorum]|nr:hypothetical protein BDZ45DRAFT_739493 [Acephala macrosclerotiorum]